MKLDRAALAIVVTWFSIYLVRVIAGHYSLGTNAFDLSVFDYTIWSLEHGGRGFVPFFGYSLFSIHFAPFVLLLVPFYAPFGSPVFLLVLQLIVVAVAGLMFFRFQQRVGVERIAALALLAVFLVARRTHSAVAGYFYPEVFQTVLTFAVVATWRTAAWKYWLSAVLLLMTKEDAPIYLAAAAIVAHFTPYRNGRKTLATVVLAVVWLAFAFLVAIPVSRSADALGPRNPILENRFGSPASQLELPSLVKRLFSATTGRNALNLVATAGGLSIAGFPWLLPALPGIVINLAADPESMQAALTDHYVWPVLPWLFMSAAAGVVWLSRRSRGLALTWTLILLGVTIADSPALQRLHLTRVSSDAREVRRALETLHGTVVLAQANLIPHLPHQDQIFAIGGDEKPDVPPDLVLLTEVGNLWPLTRETVRSEVRRYESDPAYERVTTGPLHAFRLRPRTP